MVTISNHSEGAVGELRRLESKTAGLAAEVAGFENLGEGED